MLDFMVGIVILGFVFLGLREGLAKSLGSLVLVFAALFIATGAVNFLGRGSPRFNDPNFLGATIVFLIVWLVSYILLDLLLLLIMKKIVTIVVLGPFDKVGGLLIGGFKGVVICGIMLQLILYFPLPADAKERIQTSDFSRFSIAVYHWAYPYAKRMAPSVSDFIHKQLEQKTEQMEKAGALKEKGAEGFMDRLSTYREVKEDKEKKVKELLKDKKLLPSVPQGPVRTR